MELYFSPFACSFAGRIVVHEAGLEALVTLHRVDLETKRLEDGADFRTISPLGQVPALRTREGHILTENAAILLYLSDQAPEAGLAPAHGYARYDLIRWLSFIGSELHMRVFKALVSTRPEPGAQDMARRSAPARLAHLNGHLAEREYLLDGFSVADAALIAVLNWAHHLAMDLTSFPAVANYHRRAITRPAVARALSEEMQLREAA